MAIVQAFPKQFDTAGFTANAAADIKTTPGVFMGGNVYNPGASVAYLQVHNSEDGDQTTGADGTAIYTCAIPAGASVPVGIGWPIPCGTALSFRVATTRFGSSIFGTACDGQLYFR